MPSTRTCQELIAQFSDFLDGELDAALCEKIEQHLAECSDCHTVAETVQTMLALYRGARTDVPGDAHAHLLQVLGLDKTKRAFDSERPCFSKCQQ
ncbi:MAG: zf-HC2 domain-containing protein [Anaerolineales bacterium]|nr:zf-HC2 domain-containing protein [Anaerolineales bacterium]